MRTHPLHPATHSFPFQAPLPPICSDAARAVARHFRIEAMLDESLEQPAQIVPAALLSQMLPGPNQITLITGPSGSGKSSMLRALRPFMTPFSIIDMNQITLRETPLVDSFAGNTVAQSIALLNQVGLAEAFVYLRHPSELSEGQRWRLRLALALHEAASRTRSAADPVLFADEFAAVLDRVTASTLAHRLRQLVWKNALRAIVATSHDDLRIPLEPDVCVDCDFTSIKVTRRA